MENEKMTAQWQTIDSAPLDGTAVLALVDGLHEGTGEPFIAAVAWYREGYWVVNEEGGDTYKPTHWMPLPPPPNTNGE